MPRRRQRDQNVLTSDMVGSDNPEPTSINLAVQGEYPEDYEDHPDEWKAAFDHCASKGNTVKACINYADAHEAEFVKAEAQ